MGLLDVERFLVAYCEASSVYFIKNFCSTNLERSIFCEKFDCQSNSFNNFEKNSDCFFPSWLDEVNRHFQSMKRQISQTIPIGGVEWKEKKIQGENRLDIIFKYGTYELYF